jgi:hypothetical protein
MMLIVFAVGLAIGAINVLFNWVEGHWSWHLAVSLGMAAAASLTFVFASKRAYLAEEDRRRIENERIYGMMVTEEERAVVEAMRRDERKRLR